LLVVQDAEPSIGGDEQLIAIGMKRTYLEPLNFAAPQFGDEALPHLRSSVLGISESNDLVGTGVSFTDEPGNAPNEDCGLAGSSSGHNQHGAMDVFDGLGLLRIGEERGNLTRYRH